jgi:hypothetical protein
MGSGLARFPKVDALKAALPRVHSLQELNPKPTSSLFTVQLQHPDFQHLAHPLLMEARVVGSINPQSCTHQDDPLTRMIIQTM